MTGDGEPRLLLEMAGGLLGRAEPATAGLWPRASALLGLRALEATVLRLWRSRGLDLRGCAMRTQLICLRSYLDEPGLAARAGHAWSALTRACHHHPYELAPTSTELGAWLSPQALAGAVLSALEAKDRATLEALALSEGEFREQVFPELPAWGKIPMTYVWEDLRQKSSHQVARLVASLGGQSLAVEDVLFDGGATAHKTFVVHRKPRLVVKERGTGQQRDIAIFGSVIEYEGRYKLFSYVVNR